MVFPHPEPHCLADKGSTFLSGKIQFNNQLQAVFVKLLYKSLEFRGGILFSRLSLRIGGLGGKQKTRAVAPVVELPRRLVGAVGIAVRAVRHHDLLKLIGRHQLQGGDAQLPEIRDFVSDCLKGSRPSRRLVLPIRSPRPHGKAPRVDPV